MKQITLMDYLETIAAMKTAPQALEQSETNYLVKENRLLSLAKEAFEKKLHGIELSQLEERLYSVKITQKMGFFKLLSKVAQYVTRPFLVNYQGGEEQDFFNHLLVNSRVELSVPDDTSADVVFLRRYVGAKQLLKLIFYEKGFAPLIIYGYKNESHTKKLENALFKSGVLFADLGKVLAGILLIEQMNSYLMRCEESWIHEVPFENCLLNDSFRTRKRILSFCGYNTCLADSLSDIPITCLVPDAEAHAISAGSLPLLEELFSNMTVEYTTLSEAQLLKQKSKKEHVFDTIRLIGSRKLDNILFAYHPVRMVHSTGGLSYHGLLDYTVKPAEEHSRYWGIISQNLLNYLQCKDVELLMDILRCLWDEKGKVVHTISYFKNLASDYAKSYQTKKHIPKEIQKSMEDSILNRYFGFVEMDELCDIEKVTEFAKEFASVKDAFFNSVDCSQNTIRFRRLGNHKASGLYYPNAKCLCVDINNPSSMIHEFGHLLDYEQDGLSAHADFVPVYKLYKKKLLETMDSNSVLRGTLNGKGKYNLSYYLMETEVFARSFELFIYYVLGIRNSLLPETFPEVYPQDEEFIKTIEKYFRTQFDIPLGMNTAA